MVNNTSFKKFQLKKNIKKINRMKKILKNQRVKINHL